MKIIKIKAVISCIFFIFLLFGSPVYAFASGSIVGFGVTPILPDNQINENAHYYDLKMLPGQKQNIQLEINNSSDESANIVTSITFAHTSTNGLVEYTQTDTKLADETLKYPLSSIASTNSSNIELAAHSSKIITIAIQMPEEEFDGIILGGVNVTKIPKKVDNTKVDSVTITNQFAYVIAIRLRVNEVDIQPQLHLKGIEPTVHNYRTAIAANIQNSESTSISKLEVDAKVYKVGADKPLHSTLNNDFSMAPNSNVNFMIDWGNKEILPGNYRLHMKATKDDKVWEWDELFTIKASQAIAVNSTAAEVEKSHTALYISIIIIMSIIVITLFIIILKNKRKQSFEVGS